MAIQPRNGPPGSENHCNRTKIPIPEICCDRIVTRIGRLHGFAEEERDFCPACPLLPAWSGAIESALFMMMRLQLVCLTNTGTFPDRTPLAATASATSRVIS
jgi:hypothetical protein